MLLSDRRIIIYLVVPILHNSSIFDLQAFDAIFVSTFSHNCSSPFNCLQNFTNFIYSRIPRFRDFINVFTYLIKQLHNKSIIKIINVFLMENSKSKNQNPFSWQINLKGFYRFSNIYIFPDLFITIFHMCRFFCESFQTENIYC